MVTNQDILFGLAIPFLLAAVLGGLGAWRRWAWMLPLAGGVAFVAGYVGATWPQRPRLPPVEGSDWLMWLGAGAAVVGAAAAAVRWGWVAPVLGAFAAGVTVYVIGRPLSPHAVSAQTLWTAARLVAAAAAGVVALTAWVGTAMPAVWVIGSLSIVLAGAGVLVMSSGFRTMGVYALGAGVTLGAVALAGIRFGGRDLRAVRAVRGVSVYATAVLAGALAAGRFYPEPGVTVNQFATLLVAPAMVFAGALAPSRRGWVRGVVAAAVVGVVVATTVGPRALAAKRAADHPESWDSYYQSYGQ